MDICVFGFIAFMDNNTCCLLVYMQLVVYQDEISSVWINQMSIFDFKNGNGPLEKAQYI